MSLIQRVLAFLLELVFIVIRSIYPYLPWPVYVSFHWGIEDALNEADAEQQATDHLMMHAGLDLANNRPTIYFDQGDFTVADCSVSQRWRPGLVRGKLITQVLIGPNQVVEKTDNSCANLRWLHHSTDWISSKSLASRPGHITCVCSCSIKTPKQPGHQSDAKHHSDSLPL